MVLLLLAISAHCYLDEDFSPLGGNKEPNSETDQEYSGDAAEEHKALLLPNSFENEEEVNYSKWAFFSPLHDSP